MNGEALEQLQTKIAFLERANAELSDAVYRQQREIQALTAAVKELSERLQADQAGAGERAPEDERPPHY